MRAGLLLCAALLLVHPTASRKSRQPGGSRGGSAESLLSAGHTHLQSNRLEEAVLSFRKALKASQSPGSAELHQVHAALCSTLHLVGKPGGHRGGLGGGDHRVLQEAVASCDIAIAAPPGGTARRRVSLKSKSHSLTVLGESISQHASLLRLAPRSAPSHTKHADVRP